MIRWPFGMKKRERSVPWLQWTRDWLLLAPPFPYENPPRVRIMTVLVNTVSAVPKPEDKIY